jgi:hypothetical protein
MTPTEKQKQIAVAFYRSVARDTPISREIILRFYDQWTETEEGKRLTQEERSEPEEPAINILIKISKQLDRIEGRMDKMNGNLFAE